MLLGHVVVVVLGPFLGRLQLAEELPTISPSLGSGAEISAVAFVAADAPGGMPIPIAFGDNLASHFFLTLFLGALHVLPEFG